MRIELRGHGVEISEALREHLERRVEFALDRLRERVDAVHASLGDVNGSARRGVDKECRIAVALRPSGSVTARAASRPLPGHRRRRGRGGTDAPARGDAPAGALPPAAQAGDPAGGAAGAERAVTTAIVLHAATPLDVDEARRLVDIVEALPTGDRVRIDVSSVREVHPTGLALLAFALDRDGRVTLGGLTRRQERLLGYLLGEGEGQGEGPVTAGTAASRSPS